MIDFVIYSNGQLSQTGTLPLFFFMRHIILTGGFREITHDKHDYRTWSDLEKKETIIYGQVRK